MSLVLHDIENGGPIVVANDEKDGEVCLTILDRREGTNIGAVLDEKDMRELHRWLGKRIEKG